MRCLYRFVQAKQWKDIPIDNGIRSNKKAKKISSIATTDDASSKSCSAVLYNFKQRGVNPKESSMEMHVMNTDNSKTPPDHNEKMLDVFPPGIHPTNKNPKAVYPSTSNTMVNR